MLGRFWQIFARSLSGSTRDRLVSPQRRAVLASVSAGMRWPIKACLSVPLPLLPLVPLPLLPLVLQVPSPLPPSPLPPSPGGGPGGFCGLHLGAGGCCGLRLGVGAGTSRGCFRPGLRRRGLGAGGCCGLRLGAGASRGCFRPGLRRRGFATMSMMAQMPVAQWQQRTAGERAESELPACCPRRQSRA